MKMKSSGEDFSVPHGMVLWSTGVGARPVVKNFMEQIGQVVILSFKFSWIIDVFIHSLPIFCSPRLASRDAWQHIF